MSGKPTARRLEEAWRDLAIAYRDEEERDAKISRVKRLGTWLIPGFVVSSCIAVAVGAFTYHWRRPELSEMQVLQAFPEWFASAWPLGVGLMTIYVVRSLWIPMVDLDTPEE